MRVAAKQASKSIESHERAGFYKTLIARGLYTARLGIEAGTREKSRAKIMDFEEG